MNISQISFRGNNQGQYGNYGSNRASSNQHARQAASTRQNLRQQSGFTEDDYSFSTKKPQSNKKQKPHKLNPWKAACIGLAFMHVVGGAYSQATKPADVAKIVATPGTSLEEVADIYGTDADVIRLYNNLSDNYISYSTELSIPAEYDYIGDEVEELQEDLFRPHTSTEDRDEIEERILQLQEKRELQEQIALTYTDGEYVYFKINIPTDGTASEFQQQYRYGINVEEFKDLFDIKDKAIRRYNDISYTWGSDEYGGYRDYSTETLSNGQIIKVPVNAIKTNDIELGD